MKFQLESKKGATHSKMTTCTVMASWHSVALVCCIENKLKTENRTQNSKQWQHFSQQAELGHIKSLRYGSEHIHGSAYNRCVIKIMCLIHSNRSSLRNLNSICTTTSLSGGSYPWRNFEVNECHLTLLFH